MAESALVAMSGGVDSSVAALLLKEQGVRVVGMTLKTWGEEMCETIPKRQTCCSVRDIEDARAVAARLEIPFYVVEAAEIFQQKIITPFVQGYAEGRTPNPCVTCNREIKLGILLERARALGIEKVATGHYARVGWSEAHKRYQIRQGADSDKDQSYVLSQVTQDQLARLLLPVGELTKAEVRRRAVAAGLPVAEKAESQELCFIPDGETQKFLRGRRPEGFTPGPVVLRDGTLLGRHAGVAAYTVGQRRGLGLAHPEPLYVLELDAAGNRVVVGTQQELSSTGFLAEAVHWVGIPAPKEPIRAEVKIRYKSLRRPAELIPDPAGVRVRFDEPVADGIAPGQAAVFYRGDLLLGGGWIARFG